MSETYDLFQLGRAEPAERDGCAGDGPAREGEEARARSRSIREALGIAYFRIGRWAEAEAEFRALVELAPSDEFAHYALGTRSREPGPARGGDAAHQDRTLAAAADVLRGRRARIGVRAVVQRVSRGVGRRGRERRRRDRPGRARACSASRPATRPSEAERLAAKIARLRIFENEDGRFDRSLVDVDGRGARRQPVHARRGHAQGEPARASRAAARPEARGAALRAVLRRARQPRACGVRRRLRRPDGGLARQRRARDDRSRRLERAGLCSGARSGRGRAPRDVERAARRRRATCARRRRVALVVAVVLFAPVAVATWESRPRRFPGSPRRRSSSSSYFAAAHTAYRRRI